LQTLEAPQKPFDALPIVEDEKPIFKDRQVKDFSESKLFKSALVLGVLPLVLVGCASSHESSDIKSPAPETTTNQMNEPGDGTGQEPSTGASTDSEEPGDSNSGDSSTSSSGSSSAPSRAGLAPSVQQSTANPFAPFAKAPVQVVPAKQEEKPAEKPAGPVVDVPSQTTPTVKPKPKPGGDTGGTVTPKPNPDPGTNPPVTPNPPAPTTEPTTEPTTPSEPVDDYVYKEKAFPGVKAAIEGAKEPGENRNFDSLKNFEKAAPNLTDYGQFSWLNNSALGEGKSVKVFSLFPFHRLAFREATFTPKEINQFQLMATRAVEVSDLAALKEKITGLGGEENDYFLWARGDDKRLEVVAKLVNQFDIPLTKEQKNILLGKDGPAPEPSTEPSPSEKPAPHDMKPIQPGTGDGVSLGGIL